MLAGPFAALSSWALFDVLAAPAPGEDRSFVLWVPTLLAAAGALLAITAGTLWEKRFGKSHHPVTSNAVQYLAGLAGTLPFALAFETFSFEWNIPFAAALAYLVVGNSIIAMSLLLAMIRAGEVSRVSSLFYLVPPISALMAWPLLGEAMPPLGWAGFALAAAGVLLASRGAATRK